MGLEGPAKSSQRGRVGRTLGGDHGGFMGREASGGLGRQMLAEFLEESQEAGRVRRLQEQQVACWGWGLWPWGLLDTRWGRSMREPGGTLDLEFTVWLEDGTKPTVQGGGGGCLRGGQRKCCGSSLGRRRLAGWNQGRLPGGSGP